MKDRVKKPRPPIIQPSPQRRAHPSLEGPLELTGRTIRLGVKSWDGVEPGTLLQLAMTTHGWEKTVKSMGRGHDTTPISLAAALALLPDWEAEIVALHMEMESDLDAAIERTVRKMLDLEVERKRLVSGKLEEEAKGALGR
jgi:hypothetical protein